MTMTSVRASYLCDLMDAAAIHARSRALGHASIVDRNFRADRQGKTELGREVERWKLIHMPGFDDRIYDFRTMAERVKARLKDEFGARFLRVRGALKVKCHLMFGIVALAVDPIMRSSAPSTTGPPRLTQPGSPPSCARKIHLAHGVLQETHYESLYFSSSLIWAVSDLFVGS